jgi:RHS repeat-associated protein
VKLPAAGGTVAAEGSTFVVQRNTGAVTYGIPLPELPGRAGVAPALKLVYNQMSGDPASGFGSGWRVDLPAVEVSSEWGVPYATPFSDPRTGAPSNDNLYRLHGERLYADSSQWGSNGIWQYRLQTADQELKVRYHANPFTVSWGKPVDGVMPSIPSGFEVIYPDGRVELYTGDSAIAEGTGSLVTKFPLAYEVHRQGESIAYRYVKSGERSYLREVAFASGLSRYTFDLMQSTPNVRSYKQGFLQTNGRLVQQLVASYSGQIRNRWCFVYAGPTAGNGGVATAPECRAVADPERAALTGDTPSNDRLVAILRYGNTPAPTLSSLHEPRIRFEYSSWSDNDLATRQIVYPAPALQTPGIGAANFELLDANRDGLPDVLKAVDTGASQVFFGNADLSKTFATRSPLSLLRGAVEVSPDLRTTTFQVADINGDSFVDLVQFVTGNIYFYDGSNEHQGAYEWRSTSAPRGGYPFTATTFAGGAAQFVDLNQDGLSDVVKTSLDVRGWRQWTVYLNTTSTDAAGNWLVSFAPASFSMPFQGAPSNLLSDFRYKILDVNGDGQPDLTWTNAAHGFMCVYENTGAFFQNPVPSTLLFGRSELNDPICGHGVKVPLAIPPVSQNLETWVLDVNGDGIKDFVSLGGTVRELLVWYGVGDLHFAQPVSLALNADVRPGDLSRTRVADIDGDGQEEIVVFQPLTPWPSGVVILDFNRTPTTHLIKAGLMTAVETEGGERHDIRYATSTDEVARDKNLNLSPNALHFPAIVAKQVVRSAGRRGDHAWTEVDVTEYFYHSPYFDPISREFRGFGEVDQLIYGDEYLATPTQESAYVEERFATYDPSPVQRQLSGRLLSRSVSAVKTALILSKLSNSNTFDPSDPLLHSLSTSTQTQDLVQGARLLERTVNTWKLVPQVPGTSAYFAQLAETTTTDYGGSTDGTKTTHTTLTYDPYSVVTTEHETSAWSAVPLGIVLPNYDRISARSFDQARRDLARFQAVSLPSEESTTVNGKVTEHVRTEYDSILGLPVANHRAITQSAPPAELLTRAAAGDSGYLARLRLLAVSEREELSRLSYDAYGNATSLADALGLVEQAQYDPSGVLPREHRKANLEDRDLDQLTSMTYRTDGRLATYTTPLGLEKTFVYDELGRRTALAFSDGGEETYQYRLAVDNLPNLILTTSRRYLNASSVPSGESETVARLDAYRVDGVKLGEVENAETGGVRVLSYNKYNRKKNRTLSYAPYIASTLAGRRIFSVQDLFDAGEIPEPAQADSPDQVGTSYRYDPLDRISRQVFPYGKVSTIHQEAWGRFTVETYEASGDSSKKRARTLYEVTSPLGLHARAELGEAAGEQVITRFERDAAGHLTSVQLDGEPTPRTFHYDTAGHQMYQRIPGAGERHVLRDARGREVVSIHLAADGVSLEVTDLAYDSLDRLTQRWDNGHLREERIYDRHPAGYQPSGTLMPLVATPVGLLTVSRTFDPNNLYDYEKQLGYSARGSVVRRSVYLGQRTFVENFGYTLDGALTTIITPRGLRQDLALNRGNRLERVTVSGSSFSSPEPVIEKVTYNAKNQIANVAYRKGAKTTIAYNPQTLLVDRIDSSFKDTAGADVALQSLSYEVDGDLKITAIHDEIGSSPFGAVDRTATFDYDWRGELTRATRYQRTTEYAYDGSGGFTSNSELGGAWRTGEVTGLIPRGTDASPFDYDGFGRLQTSPELANATYDAAGRLLTARTKVGKEIAYAYSEEGTRYYKRVVAADGSVTEALYPVTSYSEEPSGAQSFVFVGNKRIVRFDHGRGAESDRWFYYLEDHLGSNDILMSAAGQPVEQMLYFPYGSEESPTAISSAWAGYLAANAGSVPGDRTRHRFTGHYLDDETGLYYLGARYYHPRLGRFVTADPLFVTEPERCETSTVECNLYGYANNNPLTYYDPDGRKIEFAPGVSMAYKKDYETAIKYLQGSPTAAALIKSLQDDPGVIYLRPPELRELASGPFFQKTSSVYSGEKKSELVWHPRVGFLMKDGAKMSPAYALIHEAAHALQSLKDPVQMAKDKATPRPSFDDAEEERAIKIGNKVAGDLGLFERKSHDDVTGLLYVSEPTSTK